jgi:2-oxoisovalerate ferredoxin oxidoreductase beta subunit
VSKLLHEKPRSFYPTYERKGGDQTVTHYCPGCGHGNVHKYVAEAVDDLGIADRTIFVNPVGCAVFAYYYLDVGHIQAPHGRAPAVATAVKRARPDSIVIAYQGDGDLAAIGGNEILQAASRGESLTVIFINNALYGMTGGQLAPTSLLGQVTTTTPRGRAADQEGYPMPVCELLNALPAPAYLERVALGDAKHNLGVRRAVRRAIRNQMEGRGFSLVEVLSPCPTGWKKEPAAAARFVLETMTQTFPLGILREPKGGDDITPARMTGRREEVPPDRIPEVLGLENRRTPLSGGEGMASWSMAGIEERFRNPRIKVAGFGGQGVLFLGTLIADAGMRAGCGVSWLPSYGPEMRGGTAHCHVILSETGVDSPLVTRATVLFAFNKPSIDRFAADVDQGGLVIYDSSLIENPPPIPGRELLAVPATAIAERIGSSRVANVVALGAYLARTGVLPVAAIETTLRSHDLKMETIELNLKALEEGIRFRP